MYLNLFTNSYLLSCSICNLPYKEVAYGLCEVFHRFGVQADQHRASGIGRTV